MEVELPMQSRLRRSLEAVPAQCTPRFRRSLPVALNRGPRNSEIRRHDGQASAQLQPSTHPVVSPNSFQEEISKCTNPAMVAGWFPKKTIFRVFGNGSPDCIAFA